MHRRRQVRLSYPQAFVELSVFLALKHGRRETARALGLPLSTVYRWLEQQRRQPERIVRALKHGHDNLGELIAACEAHGFALRERLSTLEPVSPATNPVVGAPLEARGHPALTGTTSANEPFENSAALSPAVRARVQLAREEIDRHYYSQLSCEWLAGIAGMSRFHFIRTFKLAFSVAPHRYLMGVRIAHAKRLLGSTQQPLDTVAAAVGFDSQSSLCRAFKSIEHVSLASYFHGVRLGTSPQQASASDNPLARSA